MPFVRLANGPVQMEIADVEQVWDDKTQDERIYFKDAAGNIVDFSKTSADRQLTRLNLDYETVIGQTLDFSQTKKDGRTYNNIDKPGAALQRAPQPSAGRPTMGGAPARPAMGGAPAPRAAAPAAQPAITFAELSAKFGECVEHAAATLGSYCERTGVPFDGAALQSAAATLFIERNRRGI